jgi:two-component system nitrate/nitrite response regulator NarP
VQDRRVPWRTLIVEDEPVTHDVLRALLDADDRFDVVMALRDARYLLPLATHTVPELLVLDVQMTRGPSSLAELPALRAALPGTAIVMHTATGDAEACLTLGADAHIAKGDPLPVVVDRLAEVASAVLTDWRTTVPTEGAPRPS